MSDQADDTPMEGEHVVHDEGDPELLAWFDSLHAEPGQEDIPEDRVNQ